MSESERKLNIAGSEQGSPAGRSPGAATCPVTGVTIPECSCRSCVEEQIRTHAPWLLDRGFGNHRGGPRPA